MGRDLLLQAQTGELLGAAITEPRIALGLVHFTIPSGIGIGILGEGQFGVCCRWVSVSLAQVAVT